MSSEIVGYSQSNGVATITMDDGKANALSPTMIEALATTFDRAESEAKAVVLAGREGKFCAGFDLKVMMSGPDAAIKMVKDGGQLLLRLYELPMPLVIACTGHALAGGALLTATGDTRIGTLGSFKIGLNEVQNAMPVPILAHEFARARLLPTELFASVVQAKIYDPESAVAAGWLDKATTADKVVAEAQTEADRLAALPRGAYSATKRSLRRQTLEYIRGTLDSNLLNLLKASS